MNLLERLYASGGSEVILDTMAVRIGDRTHYLVSGYEDFAATLETGEQVTFTACQITVAKPTKNADGVQDLRFALSNIDGVVSTEIRAALVAKQEMWATLRTYVHTDHGAPQKPPHEMVIKGGQWTSTEVQITAGFMNILDTAWPRDRFTLTNAPGLRYLS